MFWSPQRVQICRERGRRSIDRASPAGATPIPIRLRAAYHTGMTHHPFGSTGLSVSPLGFGAAPAAFLKSDAVEVINHLLDSGINLIDTATAYPGSHEFIGQNFSHRRGDYILVSKCGNKVQGSDAPFWSEAVITYSIDRALQLMKTDHLDVMLLHSCDLKTLEKGEALGALVKAREAGKIKFAGYSGDNEAATYAAKLPDVAVIETSINIVDQQNIDGVLAAARAQNLAVIAKRPIANAAWKELDSQPGFYKNYAATYTKRLAAMDVEPTDFGFAGTDDWAEIALRFTLAQPGVSTAIVGTTSKANAEKNLAIAAKGPLPADLCAKIREAFEAADDGTWTGQT